MCTEPTEQCYFGKCENCPGSDILKNYLIDIFQEVDKDEMKFDQWRGNPISFETLIKKMRSSLIIIV